MIIINKKKSSFIYSNNKKNKKTNFTYSNNKTKKKGKTTNKYHFKQNKKKKNKRTVMVLSIFALIIFSLVTFIVIRSIDNAYKESSRINSENPTKQEFINNIEEISISEYRRSGVLPSITISQAIIESNWGESKLTQKANNLFGIKSNGNWKGPSVSFNTGENYNDVVKAKFRKYRSWEESIVDHTDFLLDNSRYRKAGIFKSKDYRVQAQALEDGGYATSQSKSGEKIYADKLINVIEKYKLYDIDKKVIGKSFFDN